MHEEKKLHDSQTTALADLKGKKKKNKWDNCQKNK